MKIYKSLRLTDIVFSVLIAFAFFFVISLFVILAVILALFLIDYCFDSYFLFSFSFVSTNFYSTNNNNNDKSTIDWPKILGKKGSQIPAHILANKYINEGKPITAVKVNKVLSFSGIKISQDILDKILSRPRLEFSNLDSNTIRSDKLLQSIGTVRSKIKVSSPQKRFLSTNIDQRYNINQNWIVGFIYGDGSFSLYIFKNKKSKLGWCVLPGFIITLHNKDLDLLKRIQSFFLV